MFTTVQSPYRLCWKCIIMSYTVPLQPCPIDNHVRASVYCIRAATGGQ